MGNKIESVKPSIPKLPKGCDTYDVVAAYFRKRLVSRTFINAEKALQILPVKNRNYGESPVQVAIAELAKLMMSQYLDAFSVIGHERHREITAILSTKTSEAQAKIGHMNILLGWLIDGSRNLSWDRIILAISFTEDVIVSWLYKNFWIGFKRFYTLLDACIMFIQDNMYEWIKCKGGWNALIEDANPLFFKETYDIPASSVYDCGRQLSHRRKPAREIPTPSPKIRRRQAKRQDNENENLDITVAYVKYKLRVHHEVYNELGDNFSAIMKKLTYRETDYQDSPLIQHLHELAFKVVPSYLDDYQAVTELSQGKIQSITNPMVGKGIAWTMYNKMFVTYLIPNNRDITWSKVLMLLQFTTDLISQLAKSKKPGYLPRIQDLVVFCSEFLNQYVNEWIKDMGGWGEAYFDFEEEESKSLEFDLERTCSKTFRDFKQELSDSELEYHEAHTNFVKAEQDDLSVEKHNHLPGPPRKQFGLTEDYCIRQVALDNFREAVDKMHAREDTRDLDYEYDDTDLDDVFVN